MDATTIQSRVDAIAKAMVAKGMRESAARLTFRSHEKLSAHLSWKHGRDNGGLFGAEKYQFFTGDIANILADADAFVAKQPDAATAKLRDFMAALGGVIDLGRTHGIETDFLNPLIATMKRLSENAITDQREAA